jgi:hypothetical protein
MCKPELNRSVVYSCHSLLQHVYELCHMYCILVYRLLDLDMVVRDDQGNILDPDITSTIQLYWQHELATERIRRATVSFKYSGL